MGRVYATSSLSLPPIRSSYKSSTSVLLHNHWVGITDVIIGTPPAVWAVSLGLRFPRVSSA